MPAAWQAAMVAAAARPGRVDERDQAEQLQALLEVRSRRRRCRPVGCGDGEDPVAVAGQLVGAAQRGGRSWRRRRSGRSG